MKRFTLVMVAICAVGLFAGCTKSPVINIPPAPPLRLIVANINGPSLLAINQPLGPTSSPSTTLTGATGGFGSIRSIAANAQGFVFAPDAVADEIFIFAPPISSTSTASTVIGPITGGVFPNSVTIDGQGNLWAADGNNNIVYEFKPPFSSGAQAPAFTLASAPAMSVPAAPSFDHFGNMYVSQEGIAKIYVFLKPFAALAAPAANISTGSCTTPASTAMDVTDRLFVSCRNDGTIRVFGPPYATGNTQIFQIGPVGASVDATRLNFDSAGNLYVSYGDIATIGVYSPPYSALSSPVFTLTTGLGFPYGVAFAP